MGSRGGYPQLSADVGRISNDALEARTKVRQSPTRLNDEGPSPLKRKRSRSPLRQEKPSEVFARSPRSHRHYREDELKKHDDKQEDEGQTHSSKLAASSKQHTMRRDEHPQSTDTEACLDWLHKNCFVELIRIERALEDKKVALAQRADFNLEEAFSVFSGNSLSRLAESDLLYGYEKLGITCSKSDAALVRLRHDADEDGRLGFWEFANILLPIEPMLRDEAERRKPDTQGCPMSAETFEVIKTVLRQVLDAECAAEDIR